MRRQPLQYFAVLYIMLLGFCGSTDTLGQIVSYPINTNQQIDTNSTYKGVWKNGGQNDTINPPFFDDFSGGSARVADSNWVAGATIFQNNTFGISPPSVGMATLDGLDESGRPYAFNNEFAIGRADSLVSKPINLSNLNDTTKENLWLSFYWQPGGVVNQLVPDREDSLVLQFKDTANAWKTVWFQTEAPPTGQNFTYASIAVQDSAWLHAGFQFRFYNYGRLSGNFDLWNLDYIRLDGPRQQFDSLYQDQAFRGIEQSILKGFTALPWKQFYTNPSQFVREEQSATLRNYDNELIALDLSYVIDDMRADRNIVNLRGAEIIGGSALLPDEERQTIAELSDTLLPDEPQPLLLRTRFRLNDNSTNLQSIKSNDTVTSFTPLLDFYAWDDGSPELARGLSGNNTFVAIPFTLYAPDTIESVAMHMIRSKYDREEANFVVYIWRELENGNPAGGNVAAFASATVFYTPDSNRFTSLENVPFTEYTFERPTPLEAGNYFVGYKQQTDNIVVGCDANTQTDSSFYYYANQRWQKFQIDRNAFMIRPVFGCPKPNPSISRNSNTLTAVGGYTDVQWYKDGQAIAEATNLTFELTEDGTYTLEARNLCGSGFSDSLAINDVSCPLPRAFIRYSGDQTIISTEENGNQWYRDGERINGETDQFIILNAIGTYYTIATNECGSDTSNVLQFPQSVSLEDDQSVQHQVYPNPTKDKLSIEGRFAKGALINALGKNVMKLEGSAGMAHLHLNDVSPGLYVLLLYQEDGTYNRYSLIIRR